MNDTDEQTPGDDIEFEMDEEIVADMGKDDKLKKLREELKHAKKQAQEHLDGWQRARADYANLQKAFDAERSQIRKRVTEDFVFDVLPVVDNFEMAMKNKDQWESVDVKWRTGIEYIYQQFKKVLDEKGVTEINEINIPFDPTLHEPLETVDTHDETQEGKVVEIMQKGYRLEGRIIRTAKVKIYKYHN
jgi:molecular chaperone GrpE